MARCDHPKCGRGDIDDQGFCTACGRAALHPPVPPASARPSTGPQALGHGPAVPGAGRETVARTEPWWGLPLIEPGAGPLATAGSGDAGPLIPEHERACPGGHPVPPGRLEGYCPDCGERFDFTRPRPFQTRDRRYEVYRQLGSGAFGAALLAYDPNLDTDVVLKDLTQSVAATARRERNALVALRHDNIVRIYGYEPNGPKGPYLVLEYVRGTPLSGREGDRLEVVLGHGLQILQALDYLHARRLLHMDVKPANIIRFGEDGADGPRDRVRLIDFGAVRELGRRDRVEMYTVDYAPLTTDPEHREPTAGFDLYGLGMTLQQLCRPHSRVKSMPGVAALDALLDRATDVRQPQRRFVSARQFAEQLSGVIRQVVAGSPSGRRIARPSAIFGAMTGPLDGGLAAARPLAHWIEASVRAGGVLAMADPFAAPAPADIVAVLPAPLADPDDPGHAQPCAASLKACRTALRRGDVTAAAEALREAGLPDWSWIGAWYSGLVALAGGETGAAVGPFEAVRDALPGELIPLLALGLCEENRGEFERARHLYEVAAATDPAFSAAAFGLARMQLRAGRRDEAVATAERLAGELQAGDLRFEQEARIAVVRLLAAIVGSHVPAEHDLERAREIAGALQVPEGTRIGLSTEIQYGWSCITGDWLALSEEIRKHLAALAGTRRELFDTMDLANRLRPPVTWPLRYRRQPYRGHSSTSRPQLLRLDSDDAMRTRGRHRQ
jgi:serine/threonine-protein kinase PknG